MAYLTTIEAAKSAIKANGGVAPKSIRRCRIERKPLATGGKGFKNQRGYEIGGKLYMTVAEILAA